MTILKNELDLQEFGNLILDSNPARVTDVLQAADRLQQAGAERQTAQVLGRLAERLAVQPDCQPPLVVCHVFGRLAGVLAKLRDFDTAEAWLQRAVTLAEQTPLSELSRRDFRGMLERLTRVRDSAPPLATPQNIAEPDLIAAQESTSGTVAASETAVTDPFHYRQRLAMDELTDEQRLLIELRIKQKKSAKEIAGQLGLSPGEVAVKVKIATDQLNAAMRRLEQAADAGDSAVAPQPAKSR